MYVPASVLADGHCAVALTIPVLAVLAAAREGGREGGVPRPVAASTYEGERGRQLCCAVLCCASM